MCSFSKVGAKRLVMYRLTPKWCSGNSCRSDAMFAPCAAGTHHLRKQASLPKATSFVRQGKQHSDQIKRRHNAVFLFGRNVDNGSIFQKTWQLRTFLKWCLNEICGFAAYEIMTKVIMKYCSFTAIWSKINSSHMRSILHSDSYFIWFNIARFQRGYEIIFHKFRQEFISLRKDLPKQVLSLVGVLITDLFFKKPDSYAHFQNPHIRFILSFFI